MADINIGGFILGSDSSTIVNVSSEYFKTQGGEIIGGLQKFTISGTISVDDSGGITTGAVVMSKLASIRNLGKKSGCSTIDIPGFFSGKAKVTNVTIEQGQDPSWVNQGSFTIEISAALDTIPTNSLGLVAQDFVTDLSRSESIEIGENAHGYVMVLNGMLDFSLTKTYVVFKDQINLTCQPICPDSPHSIIKVLKKLVNIGPTHPAFIKYQSWQPYLQSRSFESSTEGTVIFSSEIILLPPNVTAGAFVDLSFEENKIYESKQTTLKVSGTVTGLAPINWSDIIDLPNTSSCSKLSNAESAFSNIKSKFSDLLTFNSNIPSLELVEKANCPKTTTNSIGQCGKADDTNKPKCIKPKNSTISKSRTEGSISFSFEWGTLSEDQGCSENGKRTEVTVDIVEPQATIIEHIIPDFGTLIQNINCKQAKTIEFKSTTTDPLNGCSTNTSCTASDELQKEIDKYIPKSEMKNWLIITDSKTRTTESVALTKKYIRKCITTTSKKN